MKKKILGIIIFTLLATSGFGSITTAKNINLSEENNIYEKSLSDFEEKIKYVDIEPAKIPSNDLITLQTPVIRGSQVLKPPWDHIHTSEIFKEGICDAWAENTITTPYYGESTVHSWAGPAYGHAWITVWLIHYFRFRAPTTDTYIFKFYYHVKGSYSAIGTGGFTPGVDLVVNDVTLFFGVEEEYTYQNIVHNEVILHPNPDFDEYPTKTMSVYLYEGNYYTVDVQCLVHARSLAVLAALAKADKKVDDARLNSVVIKWPNSKSSISGPSSGHYEEDSFYFKIKTTDPDGDFTLPRNRAFNRPFINFLQNHLNMFPMLRHLMRL